MAEADRRFVDELKANHAPPEMIAFYGGATQPETFSIYPDTAQAIQLFFDCRQDFQYIAGMSSAISVYKGISRCELESVMNMHGIKRKQRPELLHQVKLIEAGAREGSQDTQKTG